nr:hypothetical protein [Saprospiraceae bacterium]
PFILGKNILPILLKCFYFIFHFIDNIIFVFILAIIFDLKDIEDDRKSKLMTFSVKLGLNSTLKNIMFPLIYISSIATTLFYTIYTKNFLEYFNIIPYIILLLLLNNKKNIQMDFKKFLFVFDGLMILKSGIHILIHMC